MTAASTLPAPSGQSSPHATAVRLGYLALLPFVLGAALIWGVRAEAHPHATAALSAYAAVVVSFLGGIHWGLAFRQPQPVASLFAWGVVPPLVACVAVLMPPSAGLVLHGVMLAVCYLVDRKVYPTNGAGAWLALRFRLSGVASSCCFIGAAGS